MPGVGLYDMLFGRYELLQSVYGLQTEETYYKALHKIVEVGLFREPLPTFLAATEVKEVAQRLGCWPCLYARRVGHSDGARTQGQRQRAGHTQRIRDRGEYQWCFAAAGAPGAQRRWYQALDILWDPWPQPRSAYSRYASSKSPPIETSCPTSDPAD